MAVIIKCKTCEAEWTGADECEAESKADSNPCNCAEEAKKMSAEDLLARIRATQEHGKRK